VTFSKQTRIHGFCISKLEVVVIRPTKLDRNHWCLYFMRPCNVWTLETDRAEVLQRQLLWSKKATPWQT